MVRLPCGIRLLKKKQLLKFFLNQKREFLSEMEVYHVEKNHVSLMDGKKVFDPPAPRVLLMRIC